MRGGFVVESAQHTGASCFFKAQPYPELTLLYSLTSQPVNSALAMVEKNMAITKKTRIAVVLSTIWSALVLLVAINMGGKGPLRGVFDFGAFFFVFTSGAILPLLIVWGIIWIRSVPKDRNANSADARDSK
jgi:hypothetical protein